MKIAEQAYGDDAEHYVAILTHFGELYSPLFTDSIEIASEDLNTAPLGNALVLSRAPPRINIGAPLS